MNHQTEHGAPYPRETAKQCIGEGWAPLIDRIYDYADELGVQMTILQVKEKFGGLRFYFAAHEQVYPSIEKVVNECEDESLKICESCGKPGSLRGSSWVMTLCDDCDCEYPHIHGEFIA